MRKSFTFIIVQLCLLRKILPQISQFKFPLLFGYPVSTICILGRFFVNIIPLAYVLMMLMFFFLLASPVLMFALACLVRGVWRASTDRRKAHTTEPQSWTQCGTEEPMHVLLCRIADSWPTTTLFTTQPNQWTLLAWRHHRNTVGSIGQNSASMAALTILTCFWGQIITAAYCSCILYIYSTVHIHIHTTHIIPASVLPMFSCIVHTTSDAYYNIALVRLKISIVFTSSTIYLEA